MSFYKSLSQLWLKIEQKNIVICDGNIDELIYQDSTTYKEICPVTNEEGQDNFINVIDHLCFHAKQLNYNSIKYFSANLGCFDYLENKKIGIQTTGGNDEFSDFASPANNVIPQLASFIQEINSDFVSIRENNEKEYKNIYIIECGNVLLDKQANNPVNQIASLIESFVSFTKQKIRYLSNNKIKLVILTRSSDAINYAIGVNNPEFAINTLQIPNREEREEFYKTFKSRYKCLTNACKEPENLEFKEVITFSEGLSFREMLQYAKIDPRSSPNLLELEGMTFGSLYKLLNFNKKESEWEKIDYENIQKINEILSKRVKGQDYALDVARRTLIRSFTGMNGILHSTNNRKPKGVLFLVGPTGTGKTELAKAISEFVFGDENRIIRFDMSEFSQEHSDQRLIGAPPGYVGYDAGGELTNAVKQKPFSILLFDEIEKAHGKILDKFLQILEDGRLTSSHGETIDFSEAFIIFTSNIGAKRYTGDKKDEIAVRKHYLKEVSEHFNNILQRPEILNRIGVKNIVPFNYIVDKAMIEKIINAKLEKLIKSLYDERYITLEFKNNARDKIVELVEKQYDKDMGGRGVITELETIFIDPFAEFLFSNNKTLSQNKSEQKVTTINTIHENNQLNFRIEN